jgi:hypothetical protein
MEAGLDALVEIAVLESLVRLGHAAPLPRLRELAAERSADVDGRARGRLARRLLAMAGERADAALLRSSIEDHPEDWETCGWHGAVELGDVVAERITARSGDFDTDSLRAAARALARIGGIEHAALGPDSAGALRRAWAERRRVLDPEQRHRFGRPFHPVMAAEELARDGSLWSDRRWLALEVALASRGALHVDEGGFVALQMAALDAARAALLELPLRAGAWGGSTLRR